MLQNITELLRLVTTRWAVGVDEGERRQPPRRIRLA